MLFFLFVAINGKETQMGWLAFVALWIWGGLIVAKYESKTINFDWWMIAGIVLLWPLGPILEWFMGDIF